MTTTLTAKTLTLADLAVDAAAEIVGFSPSVPADVRIRLCHLGFQPGTCVTKLRSAPMGDPCVYRLLGYDTCLRRQEAMHIEVAESTSAA